MVWVDYFYVITIKCGQNITSFNGVKAFPETYKKYEIFKFFEEGMRSYTKDVDFSFIFYNVERND